MALINGRKMQEQLQELLEQTTRGKGKKETGEKEIKGIDGKLSYAGSFERSN